MASMKRIPILQVCDSNKSESKGVITDKKLSQVCSTDGSESEIVIFNESYMEESESKSVHKSINTNELKDAIDETDDEEPSVTDNPVINDPGYLNLFNCGKNVLNNLDFTYEQACMTTSKDKYYR